MKAETKIRRQMKKFDLYPIGEINACRIWKDYEGWKIQKFGKFPWSAGRTLTEVLEAIEENTKEREGL